MLHVTDPASEPSAALPLTFLARGLDILGSSRAEIYHLTHEAIYASDFGTRPMPVPRPLDEVLRDADGAITRTIDDDDFDLCAELLLVAPYAGAPWSGAATFALTVVMEVVERLGVLPSMTFDPASSPDTTAVDRRLYFLEESYHTQYVLGFLMLATLLPGAQPPEPTRGASYDDVVLPARLAGTPALWESGSVVPPREVLVDLALLRAYARRDFGQVGTLLSEHAEQDTRVTQQVTDALVRLSTFALSA